MKFESVQLTALDFDDKTFFIGSPGGSTDVIDSISELGIINPPSVRRMGERFQIICGWKRLEACKQLGYREIPCLVYETVDLPDEDCLKFVFFENQQRLNDIDKADLVLKFKLRCNLSENDLIRKILPLIGIGATRKNLERYMSLAGLDSEVRQAYYEERISFEQAVSLCDLEGHERLEILRRILTRFRYNNNEAREIIRELSVVASRDKISIGEIIDLLVSGLGSSSGKNEFRQVLKRLRYPTLSKVEEKYKKCVGGFNLPNEIGIYNSPFFEGNDLEIRLRFGASERLSELLSHLSLHLENGGIEKLLNIVREGE